MKIDNFKKAMEIHGKTKGYKNKIQRTNNIIRRLLKRYKRPYVSYSGGKDSTVLLHITLQVEGDIDVFHYDYGRIFIPDSFEKQVVKNMKEIGAKKVHIRSNPRDKTLEGREYRSTFFQTVRQLSAELGWDLALVGLRAEESLKRKRKTKNVLNTRVKPHEAYPLRDWTWKDIYAYIFENNLPIPSVYYKYGELVGFDNARYVTYYDSEFRFLGADYIDGVLLPWFRYPKNVKR